jgi:hypothetical protein
MRIIEFDTVRVTSLVGSPQSRVMISECVRPPAVGDYGTVVHLSPTSNPDDPLTRFIVESNDGGATPAWVAEFAQEEIQFVSRPSRT